MGLIGRRYEFTIGPGNIWILANVDLYVELLVEWGSDDIAKDFLLLYLGSYNVGLFSEQTPHRIALMNAFEKSIDRALGLALSNGVLYFRYKMFQSENRACFLSKNSRSWEVLLLS